MNIIREGFSDIHNYFEESCFRKLSIFTEKT